MRFIDHLHHLVACSSLLLGCCRHSASVGLWYLPAFAWLRSSASTVPMADRPVAHARRRWILFWPKMRRVVPNKEERNGKGKRTVLESSVQNPRYTGKKRIAKKILVSCMWSCHETRWETKCEKTIFWNPIYEHHWHCDGAMSMIIYLETLNQSWG